tara:strand:+ start:185 stop:1300 length:1116 start_codon:yes stop_codon:yes gene_type:complete
LNNNLKIVSIGPYIPFRGGISDFHKYLANQISLKHNVTILNFKKLYPKILFPGKSQYKDINLERNSSLRILNPLNFLSWKRAIKKINQLNSDIVIFSYWHPFFSPMYSFIAKRISAKKIYFLIHNVKSHQFFPFQDFIFRKMIKNATHLVVMNQNEIKKLKKYNFKGKIISSFHPIYDIDFNRDHRNQFRSELGIKSEPIILFFGLIRPHKGLEILIKAVNKIKVQIPDLKVFIVGEPYTDLKNYISLIKKYGIESSFIFDSNFVNDEKLMKYFLSSDVLVLPYKKATQSGVLSLSMNFNLPSIVSSEGGLKDYVINEKTGYIVNPNKVDFADAILAFFKNNMYDKMSSNIVNHKKNFTWEKFEENLKIYD